jgi:hypothetical protein
MVGTEIIEGTIEVGGNTYRDGPSRSIEWATTDKRGCGIAITLTNHERMATRNSRIRKLIGGPAVKWKSGKIRRLAPGIRKVVKWSTPLPSTYRKVSICENGMEAQ